MMYSLKCVLLVCGNMAQTLFLYFYRVHGSSNTTVAWQQDHFLPRAIVQIWLLFSDIRR